MSTQNNIAPSRNNSLRRWSDFGTIADIQKDFNRLAQEFNRVFNFGSFEPSKANLGEFNPKVDIKDEKDGIVILAELPGLSEKEVEVTLTDKTITLKGEKKSEKEETRKGYYHLERSFGSFERELELPCEVDTTKAEARFKNGVLTVTVQKSARAKSQERKLPIKAD